MQIITLNVNGVRAAARKGFFQWLSQQAADVVCIQELKAQLPDLSDEMRAPEGYYGYFHCAEKKGYSGVGIYCRKLPDNLVEGIGIDEIDQEGRFLQADFGNLSVISLYLPSGSSGDHRQASKFFFLDRFYPFLQELIASGRDIIVCGDWNIAHKEIDLKNWRANQKNSGFLPEEREALRAILRDGWTDSFRHRYPTQAERYSWWSQRVGIRERNVGWRIDLAFVSEGVLPFLRDAKIHTDVMGSDHCPISLELDPSVLR